MQAAIEIAGVSVKPGSRQSIDIPLPSFYTHSSVNMPVHVVHGRKPGPVLLVCASLHGDEINGVEIIRGLLAHKIIDRCRGTLIAIPVINVYGFVSKSRYLPDRRDLNRSFPGSETGSMAARLANVLMTQILSHCTHIVDLHERHTIVKTCRRSAPSCAMIRKSKRSHAPLACRLSSTPTRSRARFAKPRMRSIFR